MRSKRFAIGFLVGLLSFAAVNYYTYYRFSHVANACDDCFRSFGFPFTLWMAGGPVEIRGILWEGLIGDTFVGVSLSILVGDISKRLFATSR